MHALLCGPSVTSVAAWLSAVSLRHTCGNTHTCLPRSALHTCIKQVLPESSADKESACNVGDLGSIPGLGRSPGEGKGYLLQISGLENSMGCMYSPWGRKESDTTERLSVTHSLPRGRGMKEGRIKSLGLVDASYCI